MRESHGGSEQDARAVGTADVVGGRRRRHVDGRVLDHVALHPYCYGRRREAVASDVTDPPDAKRTRSSPAWSSVRAAFRPLYLPAAFATAIPSHRRSRTSFNSATAPSIESRSVNRAAFDCLRSGVQEVATLTEWSAGTRFLTAALAKNLLTPLRRRSSRQYSP